MVELFWILCVPCVAGRSVIIVDDAVTMMQTQMGTTSLSLAQLGANSTRVYRVSNKGAQDQLKRHLASLLVLRPPKRFTRQRQQRSGGDNHKWLTEAVIAGILVAAIVALVFFVRRRWFQRPALGEPPPPVRGASAPALPSPEDPQQIRRTKTSAPTSGPGRQRTKDLDEMRQRLTLGVPSERRRMDRALSAVKEDGASASSSPFGSDVEITRDRVDTEDSYWDDALDAVGSLSPVSWKTAQTVTEYAGLAELFRRTKVVAKSLISWHVSVVLAGIVIGLFVLVGGYLQDLSPLTTLYLIVQVVTTVGYGDITPETDLQKILFCFIILLGLILIANVLQAVFEMIQAREEVFLGMAVEAMEEQDSIAGTYAAVDLIRVNNNWNNFLLATGSFIICMIVGAVFFATVENCSCSYGETVILPCDNRDFETCVATGGYQKSWVDAVYFSLVTMTTVGFGDFTPVSMLGRSVGIVWMIFGVLATGTWIGTISTMLFDDGQVQKRADGADIIQLVKGMDEDQDGFVSRTEHHVYMLVRNGLVSLETIQQLDAQFQKLDNLNPEQPGKVGVLELQLLMATEGRGHVNLTSTDVTMGRRRSMPSEISGEEKQPRVSRRAITRS